MPNRDIFFDAGFEGAEPSPLDVMAGRNLLQFSGDVLANTGFVIIETAKLTATGIYKSVKKLRG